MPARIDISTHDSFLNYSKNARAFSTIEVVFTVIDQILQI